ncbi:MAG: hypothetical protein WA749_10160, partial [Gelidibacter sp.]
FIPRGLSEELMNDFLENIESKNLDSVKSDLKLIDENYEIKEVNIGKGADWMAILAIVVSIANVFLIGDKIDKGIDGWINVGKRIKSIFTKSDFVLMDLDTSKVYGLLYLADKFTLQSIEIQSELSIELDNLNGMLTDRKATDFISKPWSIYILTYIINDKNKVILSVRSDGQIKELADSEINGFTPF